MKNRILSIILFIAVILISIFFSLYMGQQREGLDIMKNPSMSNIKKISDILNDTTIENYIKIKKIYKIVRNNALLFNVYESIAYNCMDTIKKYIYIWPIKDSNGELLDKNTILRKKMEKIKKIISNTPKNTYSEKIFKIRHYICNHKNKCDKKLSLIYSNYENAWIDIIKNYINKLTSPDNNNKRIAATFGAI